MIGTLIQVSLGGAIGASARYIAGIGAARAFGHGFPYGTLSVNVFGSLLMGILFVLLAQTDNRATPFLMTGILGGFTTFSAFSLDALKLYEAGRIGAAAGYVGASVGLSLLAIFIGVLIARGWSA